MHKRFLVACLCLLLVFSAACAKETEVQKEPSSVSSDFGSPDDYDYTPALNPQATPEPTPEYSFVPDYAEGQQNTVWGNTPSNISYERPFFYDGGSMAKQADYLYYNFSEDGTIYKMPIGATSADDVACILYSGHLDGYIRYIQVLGDWLYFCVNNNVYRMRTDGTMLEAILALDNVDVDRCPSGNFVVYKDRIYYTKNEKTNVTASTYAYKRMLMSCALDGTDTRCDFLTERDYDYFYIKSYNPAGYLYLNGYSTYLTGDKSSWMLYSLEDSSCYDLDYKGNSINVGWDSTTYFHYNNALEYALSINDVISNELKTIKKFYGYFLNADDAGFYFSENSKIKYFDYKTKQILAVSPDNATSCILPGDEHLYYYCDGEWYRIATVNGGIREGSWERIDWMTPPYEDDAIIAE